MRQQRYPMPPFWTNLLATAASLTLFLPAAISMNSATPPTNLEKFRLSLSAVSAVEASQRQIDGEKIASYLSPSHLPAVEKVADPPGNDIHSTSLRKTKGSLSLQTAARVGSSAAAAAASFICHEAKHGFGR